MAAVDLVDGVVEVLLTAGEEVEFLVRVVSAAVEEASEPVLFDVDLRGELARREGCPAPLQDGWWPRSLDQIDGVTIHHTLGHDPRMLARGYVHKGGGRPSIPYHLWVGRDGVVSYCLDLEEGCWHDHTGHKNTHVSVGLAGVLDVTPPSPQQVVAAVRVTVLLLDLLGLDPSAVRGHQAYFATRCPGWGSSPRFLPWRADFFSRL